MAVRQPQHAGGLVQHHQGHTGVQRPGAILFGEFFTVGIQHQRCVQVMRLKKPEGLLQQNLPGGVVGQVFAPHHMRYALRGVVDHHGQLVGKQAIGPLEDKVAHFGLDVLLLVAQPAVKPVDDFGFM